MTRQELIDRIESAVIDYFAGNDEEVSETYSVSGNGLGTIWLTFEFSHEEDEEDEE